MQINKRTDMETGGEHELKPESVFGVLYVLIFTGGFLIRLYFLFKYGNDMTLDSDDVGYINSAMKLLSSGMLTYNTNTPTVFIMPAFPIYLSLMIKVFGPVQGLIAARFFQIIGCMVGYYFLYRIASRFFMNKYFALLITAVMIFYPTAVIMPNLLLTETWYTVFVVVGAYLCILFLEKPSIKLSITLGAVFAAAIYFRPVIAMLPVLIGIIFFLAKNGASFAGKIKLCLLWAAVVVLLLSPWWVRNYRDFKMFIPLTASSGNPLLYGSYIDYEDILYGSRDDWPHGKTQLETDQKQKEMAVQRIKVGFKLDFARYMKWYAVSKFVRLWRYPFAWNMPQEFPPVLYLNYHKLLWITGLLGCIMSAFVYRRSLQFYVVLAFVLYSTVLYMVYVAYPRYCFPQLPLVAIFSGVFLQTMFFGIKNGFGKLKAA